VQSNLVCVNSFVVCVSGDVVGFQHTVSDVSKSSGHAVKAKPLQALLASLAMCNAAKLHLVFRRPKRRQWP
jgi:uncharacterized OsmC-like protein